MADPIPPQHVSFDEFQLYYESTERVTDRRLELNRWNYSVVTAILVAVGLVLNWATAERSHIFAGICGIAILCLMALGLCTYWIRQISDFKALNAAKFGVLNKMAPLIQFESSSESLALRKSYLPFEREWTALRESDSLTKVRAGRIKGLLVLSAANAEYFIPRAFRIIYLAILLGVLIFAVTSHRIVFDKVSPFGGIGVSSTPTSGPTK